MSFNPADLIAGGVGKALFGDKGLTGTVIDTLKDAGVIKDREGEERARNALMAHDEKIAAIDAGLAQGQIDINKIEAASPNEWVSGWRPAIGWTCATGLFVYYVPRALIVEGMWIWACWKAGAIVPFPEMGIADLLGLTGSLLGIHWMRSEEVKAGVARRN